jgi:hypothetical protein
LVFYVGPRAGKDGNPIKSLVGFEKIFVEAGATETVNIEVSLGLIKEEESGMQKLLIGPTEEYAYEFHGAFPVVHGDAIYYENTRDFNTTVDFS